MDKADTASSADQATNPVLAANFMRLKGERSYETLRAEMAAAGIAIGLGTLNRLGKGQVGGRLETLEKVATFFRIAADQLLQPDLGEVDADDFVPVPEKQVALSAGPGRLAYLEDTIGTLKFRSDFLRSVGINPKSAAVVKVKGYSMEPTIPDGAVVLVNQAQKEPRERVVYALRVEKDLLIKRLVRINGLWIARSDNEDRETYPDFELIGDDINIIGRVVWMGARL